jgi:hypothetical protein
MGVAEPVSNDDLKRKFEEHNAAVEDLVATVGKLRAATVDFEKQLDEELVEKQKILEAVEKELQQLKDEICEMINQK